MKNESIVNCKEILLNLMGKGAYLDDNLGHEIINLFRDDLGDNYIYIQPWGTFDSYHKDKIDVILLAQRIGNGCIEILAKAWNLVQIVDLSLGVKEMEEDQIRKCSQIKYGGTSLPQIYSGNKKISEMKSGKERPGTVFVSFMAREVRKSKKRLFITENKDIEDVDNNIYYIPQDKKFTKQSLKEYFPSDSNAFKQLMELINNSELWEDRNTTERVDVREISNAVSSFNFLRLIGKEDDEIAFSNLFVYYFRKSQKLCRFFVHDVLRITDINDDDDFIVMREHEHIDLLLVNQKHIIVIENKIKSKINGIKYDINGNNIHSQLQDYVEIAKKIANGRKISCFIFLPDYNNIKLDGFPDANGNTYVIIKYSRIWKFFKNFYTPLDVPDEYYIDFLKAMQKHTTIGTLQYEMKERFWEAIKTRGNRLKN